MNSRVLRQMYEHCLKAPYEKIISVLCIFSGVVFLSACNQRASETVNRYALYSTFIQAVDIETQRPVQVLAEVESFTYGLTELKYGQIRGTWLAPTNTPVIIILSAEGYENVIIPGSKFRKADAMTPSSIDSEILQPVIIEMKRVQVK